MSQEEKLELYQQLLWGHSALGEAARAQPAHVQATHTEAGPDSKLPKGLLFYSDLAFTGSICDL